MQNLIFNTKILKNGIIQIPTLRVYENQEIEIVVKLKSETQPKPDKDAVDNFFEKWGGFFSTVQTEDIRYNELLKKHR